jgi:hypothetical protein
VPNACPKDDGDINYCCSRSPLLTKDEVRRFAASALTYPAKILLKERL